MKTYENYFERVENQAHRISELIEELILLDDLIATHQQHQSEGLGFMQYAARRNEFKEELDKHLSRHRMKLVFTS